MSKISAPFVRSAYNYDRMAASDESAIFCDPKLEPGANQEQRDDCNPNVIMERFARTGLLPTHNIQPLSGEFHGFEDYHSSLNRIIAAQEAFDALPATVRSRFQNDPGQLLAFLENPDNRDEAVELGLVSSPEPSLPPPAPAQAVGGKKGDKSPAKGSKSAPEGNEGDE